MSVAAQRAAALEERRRRLQEPREHRDRLRQARAAASPEAAIHSLNAIAQMESKVPEGVNQEDGEQILPAAADEDIGRPISASEDYNPCQPTWTLAESAKSGSTVHDVSTGHLLQEEEAKDKVRNDDASNQYDQAYFDDWISSLRDTLTRQLPALPRENSAAFSAAGTACQSAAQALNHALAWQQQVWKKQQPVDEKEDQAAQRLVDDTSSAVEDCRITGQHLAKPLLHELQDFLSPDFDDTTLLQVVILTRFGSARAAAWCARDESHNFASLTGLLSNAGLMRTLLQNGGAKNGQYGRCLELLESLPKPNHPVLQRLALAVALEMAQDIESFVRIPPEKKIPELVPNIDPLQRYVQYEQAYLFGELDEAFADLTVWELRMVINSNAPNDELGWCRQSLMNYRPNIVLSNDPQWRYCQIVRTDVTYQDPVWYKEKRTYDQILSGGGECGPRAWYGRFSCKAFGIPTWGVRQPGHAAMTRWTNQGEWMTALGNPRWELCWWDEPLLGHRGGVDFLLETQARSAVDNYQTYLHKVLRLEWMALFHGESGTSVAKDCVPDPSSPWWALSMMQRRILAATSSSNKRGPCVTKALPPTQRERLLNRVDGREVQVGDPQHGTIVIPAATCSCPSKPTKTVYFMKSFLGGQQIHLVKSAVVEYTLSPDLLTAETAKYHMTLQVCNVHRDHLPLRITVMNGGTLASDVVELPYTMGEWGETKPFVIKLGGPGARSAKITISRQDQRCGFALKLIKLTPHPSSK